MVSRNNRVKEENAPKAVKGWLVFILPIIIPTLGLIFIELLRQHHEIKTYEIENTYTQRFNCKTISVEKVGIEYVEYKITTDPIVKGFHIIVYPYLVCENEKKVYIPVTGLFTQNEYVADEKGCCTLSREDTFEELKETIKKMNMIDFPVEVRCLVAIKYVKQDEEQKEIYDIKDGQLTKSHGEIATKVLEAWESKSSLKIDMIGWPDYDQEKLEEILVRSLRNT